MKRGKKFTVVDLFSGCGGMSWGLKQEGFLTLAGIDLDEQALSTFKLNHEESRVFSSDIRKLPAKHFMKELGLEKGELDCLVGGPPCQGFSKNVPAKGRFMNDPRNLLFRNFMEYVKKLFPRVLIMENVAEIYNAYDGEVRKEIEDTLSRLGYKTVTKVLFAPDYGIPQRRRRCFFFASRTKKDPEIPVGNSMVKIPRDKLSAWGAISDLPVLNNGEGHEPMKYDTKPKNDYQKIMRGENQELYDHSAKSLKDKQFLRIASLKPGQAWRDLPKELQPKSGYSGAYGRLDFEMLAPTMTRWLFHPGSGRFSHPKENRLLTIREAARIQSFSDDFKFTGSYVKKASQVGNAVPPLLMLSLAPKIKSCLLSD